MIKFNNVALFDIHEHLPGQTIAICSQNHYRMLQNLNKSINYFTQIYRQILRKYHSLYEIEMKRTRD